MLTHYKPRKISQIAKTDSKIAIIGRVIEIGDNSFILDDGNKIEIFSDRPVEKDKLLRVFCSIVDGKLKADVIQNVEGLDLNLFKKVEELYNKSGV